MKNVLLIVLLVTLSSFVTAKEKVSYLCHSLTDVPLLDGKVSEWSNISKSSKFYVWPKGYAARKQTHFRSGWRDDAIYIAVECQDPNRSKSKMEMQDGDPLWSDESIEIFLFPEKADVYFQFVVNAAGKMWNGIIKKPQPLGNWQARTYKGKTTWSLEVKIPFDLLKRYPPREGEKWLVSVTRNTVSPASEKYTVWSPGLRVRYGFHDTENFGSFTFTKKNLSLVEQNKDRDAQISYLMNIAKSYPKYEAAIKTSFSNSDAQKQALALEKDWKVILKLPKTPSANEINIALQKSRSLLERSEKLKMKMLFQKLVEDE